MSKEDKIYSVYSTFRNQLRHMKLIESLDAIHSHLLHQQFRKSLPTRVGAPAGYRNSKKPNDFISYSLHTWELEILAKEVLINSPYYSDYKSLQDWNQMAKAVNKLKAIDEEIAKQYITRKNVLLELNRIPHRQFIWQRNPSVYDIAKYWKIYRWPKLSRIIEKELEISLDKLFLISMSLIGGFMNHFIIWYPPNMDVVGVDTQDLDKFLNRFCKGYEEIKYILKEELQLNEKYNYAFHSLKAYPLVKINIKGRAALICPVLTLLFKRITDGIYYEICSVKEFNTHFGDAYQDYIGGAININKSSTSFLLTEEKYGKPEKRTADWILGDDTAVVFVECKSKRLTFEAKMNLINTDALDAQLDILAESVVQVYKSAIDYKNDKYPHLKYDSNKKLYCIISTLEDWYFFGDVQMPKLNQLIRDRLLKENIPPEIIEEHPYFISSTDGINIIAQATNEDSLSKIFEEKYNDKDKRMWQLETYLSNKYPKSWRKVKIYGEEDYEKFWEENLPQKK